MTNNDLNANIVEIFSSIQGEGPYIGYRQLFVRFALCNLSCMYCDTKYTPEKYSRIETYPGKGSFKEIKNPVNIDQLIFEIEKLNCFNHHSLSLTGGEPLLSSDFLDCFLGKLNKINKNLKVYLETNGALPLELEKIIDRVDIISMDFKLASSCGNKTPWNEHKEFLKVAQNNNKEIFSKIVITSKIMDSEIDKVVDLILSLDREIPVILQPVSSSQDSELLLESGKLLSIQERMLNKLTDVRIIPQVHKYLNLL
jgi:organic radical activating enzyme